MSLSSGICLEVGWSLSMTLAFLCLFSCPCSVLNSLYCVPVHYFSFQFYWKTLFSTLYSLELNLYIDFTSLTTFSMDFSFSSAYSCLTSAYFCFTISFLYKNHSFYLFMGPKACFLYVVYRLLHSDLIFVGSVSWFSLPRLISSPCRRSSVSVSSTVLGTSWEA